MTELGKHNQLNPVPGWGPMKVKTVLGARGINKRVMKRYKRNFRAERPTLKKREGGGEPFWAQPPPPKRGRGGRPNMSLEVHRELRWNWVKRGWGCRKSERQACGREGDS